MVGSESENSAISLAIQDFRASRNFTIQESAFKLDITAGAYSHWENGRRKPSRESVAKLIRRFGLSEDEQARLLEATGFSPVDYLDSAVAQTSAYQQTVFDFNIRLARIEDLQKEITHEIEGIRSLAVQIFPIPPESNAMRSDEV